MLVPKAVLQGDERNWQRMPVRNLGKVAAGERVVDEDCGAARDERVIDA